MRVEIVCYRDGCEGPVPPTEAERLAMAERCVTALLQCAYPGARVTLRRRSPVGTAAQREPGC